MNEARPASAAARGAGPGRATRPSAAGCAVVERGLRRAPSRDRDRRPLPRLGAGARRRRRCSPPCCSPRPAPRSATGSTTSSPPASPTPSRRSTEIPGGGRLLVQTRGRALGRAARRLAPPARRLRRSDLVAARPLRRRRRGADAERASSPTAPRAGRSPPRRRSPTRAGPPPASGSPTARAARCAWSPATGAATGAARPRDAAPVAPAWSPLGDSTCSPTSTPAGSCGSSTADSGERLAAGAGPAGRRRDGLGRRRSACSKPRRGRCACGGARLDKLLAGGRRSEAARALPVPPRRDRGRDAALAPAATRLVAARADALAGRAPRSAVVVYPPAGGRRPPAQPSPASLAELAWSPGRRAASWSPGPKPTSGSSSRRQAAGRARSADDRRAPSPRRAARRRFPRVEGWCCRPRRSASALTQDGSRREPAARSRRGSAGTIRVGDLLMARAIWSGSISFGLLNVPVKLYSAVARRNIAPARDPRVRQRPDQTPPRRRGDRRGGPLREDRQGLRDHARPATCR